MIASAQAMIQKSVLIRNCHSVRRIKLTVIICKSTIDFVICLKPQWNDYR